MKKPIEGKTKIIRAFSEDETLVLITNKDDITAGDGDRRHTLPGKGELATRTTANVFEYLHSQGVPVAYIGSHAPNQFIAKACTMIPVEFVVRNVAVGSYLKRNPGVAPGTLLSPPVIEYYYKTKDRRLGEHELPCDDPLMIENGKTFLLHEPSKPLADGFITSLADIPVQREQFLLKHIPRCRLLTRVVGELLTEAWHSVGGRLLDLKIECGIASNGEVVVADVIDCDSWRVTHDGEQLSKQVYRDGGHLKKVLDVYVTAAELTDMFVSRD